MQNDNNTNNTPANTLSPTQLIQEVSYFLPYHYFWNKKSLAEIIYDSYLSLTIDLVQEVLNKETNIIKILDVGCGDGRLIYELRKKINPKKVKIYGLDYSAAAITFAKIYNPTAEFSIRDLACSGYPAHFFDIIICMETLEHIVPKNLSKVINEFSHIIKNSGKLIITTPSKKEPPEKSHYQHFTYFDLKALLSPYFKIEKSFGNDKRNILLNLFYILMENKFYKVKHKRLINLLEKVYNKFGKVCQVEEGRRIILLSEVKFFLEGF